MPGRVATSDIDESPLTLGNRAVHADVAERIALAFLHGDCDRVFVARLVELAHRRYHLEVGIAVIVVEAAQRLLVGAETVLVVDVVTHEERQQTRALRRDYVRKPAVAVGLVADEVDGPDFGAAAFVDVVHDVDAILAEIDRAGRDHGVVASDAGIGGANCLGVRLELVGGERAARLQLHGGGELGILELAVALKQNLVDDLVFRDLDDERSARLIDAHVREQPGSEQPLHQFVDIGRREGDARLDGQIAANRRRIDALIALHVYRGNDRGLGHRDRSELNGHRSRHHQRGGQSRRRGGVQQTRYCLHRAKLPFLEVPTARKPVGTVLSSLVLPGFSLHARLLVNLRLLNRAGVAFASRLSPGMVNGTSTQPLPAPDSLHEFQHPNRSFQKTKAMKARTRKRPARYTASMARSETGRPLTASIP